MCISNNFSYAPSVQFNDTILYGAEVRTADGKIRHALGYYNKVRSLSAAARRGVTSDDFGWDIPAATGNAMLIAVPARPGTLTPDCLIPVGKMPRFMEDYKIAVARPMSFSSDLMPRGAMLGGSKAVVVKGFDEGTYDVIIAANASAIPGAISQVDEAKRPLVNEDLYRDLDTIYGDRFSFLLFCFSELQAEQAGCALIVYEPNPEWQHLLYLPGLDGHGGTVPTGTVKLDHTLVVGSCLMKGDCGEITVNFRDLPLSQGERPYYLLDRVIGRSIPAGTEAPQGDFLFSLKDVRAGIFRAKRQLPPGWSRFAGTTGQPAQPHFIK